MDAAGRAAHSPPYDGIMYRDRRFGSQRGGALKLGLANYVWLGRYLSSPPSPIRFVEVRPALERDYGERHDERIISSTATQSCCLS